MKRLLLLILAAVASINLMAQHVPVAVDDYVVVPLEDSIIINVIQNDYHPDSVPFRVYYANGPFTDSTITVFLSYRNYWNYKPSDTVTFDYQLMDENGNIGWESVGKLFITIENSTNQSRFLDINSVKARVQPAGFQFWRGSMINANPLAPSDVGYIFPKESGKSTVFSSGVWVGGLDETDSLHLSAERYRQVGMDYWPGPVSVVGNEVTANMENAVAWSRVWKLSKDELIYHKFHYADPNYQPIEAIATWPAMGDESLGQAKYLAPFVDVDGDSIYNPMNGDYPLIRGDQCVFFILNDVRNHTETKGDKMGIEMHVMAYEFYNPDTLAMQNTVFYSYKIFNRSSHTYHKTLFGLYTDFDIGSAWDDYLGCDVARGLSYGYNDSVDGNGEPEAYGDTVPAQTVLILSGPLMDSDNQDNPSGECNESINGTGFGDGIIDNERYGMTRFTYFRNGGLPAQSDPEDASQYYDYMNGIWKDGTVFEYGGSGHVSDGAYGPAARFVFPGLTDPCYWGTNGEEPYGPVDWTMRSAGMESSDIRGMAVSGDFTFKPGDMQRLDIAYVSAFAEEGKTALETVLEYSDLVKAKYMKDPDHFGYQYLGVNNKTQKGKYSKLEIWPNPVNDKVSFTYNGKDKTAYYNVRNLMGSVVASGQVAQGEIVIISLNAIANGLYIINLSDSEMVYAAKVIKQ
ncbi:MAG: hypothetical protein DRJ09_08700 [Bacteroidetes bacterium]|nr:MAG: hypothetical protein DRJ09_08700 [Bacteroidota bacterium]